MKAYLNDSYADLVVAIEKPLLWVTLNRPQCSNAFSDEMISELCRLLREADWDGIQQIPLTIEALHTPIIAMVNGPAIGAGCDLACMCDIRMGCRHSRFGETFAKLALVPGDGGTFFLQRVIGYAKAMELTLTGRIVTAEEALSLGLLNCLVERMTTSEESGG